MARLRDDLDSLFALVGDTSQETGLRQSWVEKDFWITELLRSVSKDIDDAYAVFKGGTSLSKTYRLTQRFSQDVDILLVVTTGLSKSFGAGSIDKRLKEVTDRAATDLGLEGRLVTSTKGRKRYTTFTYPSRIASDEIPREVLLEMGTRGGDDPPSNVMTTSSYVAEHVEQMSPDAMSEFEEFTPVQVRVLALERTLTEKLSLLHDLGTHFPSSNQDLSRAARHVYDIAVLLRSQAMSAG